MDGLYYIIRDNGQGATLANYGYVPHDTKWTSDPTAAIRYTGFESQEFINTSEYKCERIPANSDADFKRLTKHLQPPIKRGVMGLWDENIVNTLIR